MQIKVRDQYAAVAPDPSRTINKETVDLIFSGLSDTEWRTIVDIGWRIGRSPQRTAQILRRIQAERMAVESQSYPMAGGGAHIRWRKLPPGSVAPLYEQTPGWDDRALREAMSTHL